jgi:hypothetical protein
MIPSILIVSLLLYLLWRFLLKGKTGNYSSGAGNALFQLHTFVRPSNQNIVEAKKQRKKDAEQGDDGPPELSPWAQSGS